MRQGNSEEDAPLEWRASVSPFEIQKLTASRGEGFSRSCEKTLSERIVVAFPVALA
jgi:hypothetical protein